MYVCISVCKGIMDTIIACCALPGDGSGWESPPLCLTVDSRAHPCDEMHMVASLYMYMYVYTYMQLFWSHYPIDTVRDGV